MKYGVWTWPKCDHNFCTVSRDYCIRVPLINKSIECLYSVKMLNRIHCLSGINWFYGHQKNIQKLSSVHGLLRSYHELCTWVNIQWSHLDQDQWSRSVWTMKTSNEPINPLWPWIHGSFWCNMIQTDLGSLILIQIKKLALFDVKFNSRNLFCLHYWYRASCKARQEK